MNNMEWIGGQDDEYEVEREDWMKNEERKRGQDEERGVKRGTG
jgi:hypothetical protein